MSLYGALDKTNHLSEFGDPLVTNEGVLTPGQRRATARANLKLGAVGDNTVQELTSSGAVTSGVTRLELNHATVVIAATIASFANHEGLFVVADTSASGTAAHTLTLTSGTFDGTNNTATLNAPGEQLIVFVDKDGAGTIIANIGSVALSSV